jgi:hypothetical protein
LPLRALRCARPVGFDSAGAINAPWCRYFFAVPVDSQEQRCADCCMVSRP